MIKYIPNLLSASRIFMSLYAVQTFFNAEYIFTIILFAICIVTDFIDGPIARYHNVTSELGKHLDIIGDLASILSISFLFYHINPIFLVTFLPNGINHIIKFFDRKHGHIEEVEMTPLDDFCAILNQFLYPSSVFLAIAYPNFWQVADALFYITPLAGALAAYRSFKRYQNRKTSIDTAF
ncbi:MAG: CDP-alcohol phosphatidyltransferase family protein [Alphaproteobacteria bacterium]|nr:MAG: CDP-alcohol phosphatidyltransferase family protein [Alphaproteobacteria bacterium]